MRVLLVSASALALAHGFNVPVSMPSHSSFATRSYAQVKMESYAEYLAKQGKSPPPQERTRDSGTEGGVSFDNDMSGWKPSDQPGSKHTMSGGFESTDTPDFFDENDPRNDIEFTEGMFGSQVQNANKDRNTDPGVAGALDVNPDVYVYAEQLTDVDTIDFGLSTDIKMTDLDFDMVVQSTMAKDLVVSVRPVMMTYEEFYCGFTSDSHQAFTVSPNSGKMEKRGGANTDVTVTVTPNGRAGELVGYLCFILPDEKAFSTYYKITAKSI